MTTLFHNDNSESSFGGLQALGKVPVPDSFESAVRVKTMLTSLPVTPVPSGFEQAVLKQIGKQASHPFKKYFYYGAAALITTAGLWYGLTSYNNQTNTVAPQVQTAVPQSSSQQPVQSVQQTAPIEKVSSTDKKFSSQKSLQKNSTQQPEKTKPNNDAVRGGEIPKQMLDED